MGTGASWRNQIPADAPVALAEEVRELRRRLRRTQRELRAVRARYRLLYQRGPAANFVIGRRGTILDVDEKSARSLGYAADALIGRDVLELTPPRRRKALAGALKRAFGGVPSGRLEVEFLGRRGPKRFLLPEGYLPLKQNGRVEAVLGSGIDVTDWGDGRLTLRRLLRDQHRFERRLTALQEVVNELSTTDTVEQLCRRAIQLGRRRLGFDRLGLWFLTDEPNVVRGCFGTDVRGRVRDIRGVVGPVDPDSLMGRILNDRISLGVAEDEDLLSAEGEVVGRGTLVIASLWDGQKITGCLCADNLLRGEPFSPQQCELLRLYASALAYGCSRKRAEEALRRSEERFRTFFEASPIGIEVYDAQGRLTDTNRACLDLFGVSDISEVMGFDLFADPNLTDAAKRRLRRGQTVRFERLFDFEKVRAHNLYRTSRRGSVWVDALIAPLRSAEGDTKGYLLTVQDITERKRAEEHLRLYRMAVEASQDLITAVDRECRYVLANEAFLRRYGLKQEQVLGRSVAEVLGEEFFRKNIKPHVERCLRGQTVRFEATLPSDWGSDGWFEVLYYPLPGKDKKPVGLVGVMRDITHRRKAEEALRRSEQQLRLIWENSSDGINVCECDPVTRKHRLVMCNDRFVEMSGRSREELMAADDLRPLARGLTPPEQVRRNRERRRRGLPTTGLASWIRPDGRENYYEWTAARIRVGGKQYLIGIDRDITERVKSQASLRELHLKLMNAREAERKRLAAELHDAVGQGLVALRLGLRAVQQQCPQGAAPPCGKMLKVVLRQCDRLVGQVRRVCRGVFPPALETLGLAGALRQLAGEFRSRCAVSLRCYGPMRRRRLGAEVEIALFRIAQEACTNAVVHGRAGRVWIDLRRADREVRLTVSDDGVGFDPAAAAGKGLGLGTMRERAEAVGGVLEISSRPGRTRVRARVPLGDRPSAGGGA